MVSSLKNTTFSLLTDAPIQLSRDMGKRVSQKASRLLGKELWDLIDETTKQNKFLLNQEFKDRVLLKNRLTYCWYPTESSVGHTQFEIDGMIVDSYFFRKKITLIDERAENDSKLYSQRIGLHVTPREMETIVKSSHEHWVWSTCSHNTASLIGYKTAIKIPFPFSISPLLSRGFIELKKIQSWDRLGDIQSSGKLTTLIKFGGPSMEIYHLLKVALLIFYSAQEYFSP